MSKIKGLSLIEILVVVAIIAVLASIIMTVGKKSISKTKEVVCVSNLKQIHLAMNLYLEDNGSYPPKTLSFPGFAAYFKGSTPICPSARLSHRDLYVDYYVHAGYTAKSERDRKTPSVKRREGQNFR